VVEPLGAHLLVTCDVEGASFRAVLDSDLTVRPGDILTLAPQPDRIRWSTLKRRKPSPDLK
jgi:multiple sugar transport system ATP-binding protein